MGAVVFVSILIVLAIIVFFFVSKDGSRSEKDGEGDFERTIVMIIDRLQTGEVEGIENLFREIVKKDSSKVEFYVILANILREKGFISEAINIHKSALKRHDVLENLKLKGWVLGNLAEDFRKGGMIDRALRTYKDALALMFEEEKGVSFLKQDFKNKAFFQDPYIKMWLGTLLKRYSFLLKQVGDYESLLSLTDIMKYAGCFKGEKEHGREVAFIYNQIGEELLKSGNVKRAIEYFNKGLSIYGELYPAYLNLIKIYKKSKTSKAVSLIDDLISSIPEKGFLVLPVLKEIAPKKFEDRCVALLNLNENDWRVRLELGRFYLENGNKDKALYEFKKCIELAPMVLIIHQEIWKYLLKHPDDVEVFKEYANTLNRVLVFSDPFVCSKCNYKSSEFLWKCPYCHEFDTFIELRL